MRCLRFSPPCTCCRRPPSAQVAMYVCLRCSAATVVHDQTGLAPRCLYAAGSSGSGGRLCSGSCRAKLASAATAALQLFISCRLPPEDMCARRYYAKQGNTGRVLRKVSNQVVKACTTHILAGGQLWERARPGLIADLTASAQLHGAYLAQYRSVFLPCTASTSHLSQPAEPACLLLVRLQERERES